MKIEVSNGEILDKYSILLIKKKHITDTLKLTNIEKEIQTLYSAVIAIMSTPELVLLYHQLFEINEQLWEIEDRIREHERKQIFNLDFINLARSVYKTNDKRAVIKKEINLLTKSALLEEKSYEHY